VGDLLDKPFRNEMEQYSMVSMQYCWQNGRHLCHLDFRNV
jgi:hypothetical protein